MNNFYTMCPCFFPVSQMNHLMDSDQVFFFSIHLWDDEVDFYPMSGKDDNIPKNIMNAPIDPLWTMDPRAVRAVRGDECKGHVGREEFRRLIKSRLLPTLHAYNPDIIFLSSGFDAGKEYVHKLLCVYTCIPSV